MAKAKGIKEVAYVDVRNHAAVDGLQPVAWHDCAGGGQVVVERDIAYVGNMRNPHGTLIIDVKDPRHPKPLAEISMPPGTHSHKVRVHDGIMITNREILGAQAAQGEIAPEGYHGAGKASVVARRDGERVGIHHDERVNRGPKYARG